MRDATSNTLVLSISIRTTLARCDDLLLCRVVRATARQQRSPLLTDFGQRLPLQNKRQFHCRLQRSEQSRLHHGNSSIKVTGIWWKWIPPNHSKTSSLQQTSFSGQITDTMEYRLPFEKRNEIHPQTHNGHVFSNYKPPTTKEIDTCPQKCTERH